MHTCAHTTWNGMTAAFRFFSTPTEFTVTLGWQGTVIIKKNKVWSFCKSAEKIPFKKQRQFFPPENVVLLNYSLYLQLSEPLPKPGVDFFLTRWSLLSPQGWRCRRQWDSPPSESLTWSLKLTPYRCADPKRHLTALSFFWKNEEHRYVSESCFKSF